MQRRRRAKNNSCERRVPNGLNDRFTTKNTMNNDSSTSAGNSYRHQQHEKKIKQQQQYNQIEETQNQRGETLALSGNENPTQR